MLQQVFLALTLLGTVKGLGNPLDQFLYKRQAPREPLFVNVPASVDLEWYSCGNGVIESKFECARLSVPLDYKRPENGLRAIVPIVKFPAESNVPYKGSVLYNPGGPGQPGVELIYLDSFFEDIRSDVVGPGWDIIAFDPRGMGYSIPHGSCNITPGTFVPGRQNATTLPTTPTRSNTRHRRRAPTFPPNNDEVVFNMLIPDDPPSRKTIAYAEADSWTRACQELVSQYNQAGPHMNTVVMATDMLSIAQALAREKNESNTILNYYGPSYGSLLGQYFATLYPDNVGKFYLDGVVDADTWVTQDNANTTIIHVDKIWSKFFSACYDAGPTKCSMFTGRNSHAVRDRFNAITAKLNATKYELEGIPEAPHLNITSLLWTIKGLAFGGGYSPSFIWPLLSNYLVSLETLLASIGSANRDPEVSRRALSEFEKRAEPAVDLYTKISESFYQVACTDARDLRGVEITDADWKVWKAVSKIIGPYKLADRVRCTKWPIRPSWEWYGPVGGKTRTPILFAGTTLDLITPLINSEKARTLFKGAKMLYVDEIMHTVSGTKNRCAARHVLAYFQNGTLPGHDNRCKGEATIFK
ncbi:hypothetical protein TWF102_004396 [Orbilia oligospora]|uniref:Peptidase S33 tripeptidyl aminopeptidase-like C-terminal domain-containing protein n=1 Tax=Orbilia oligospora TaxID=2813651 RepID=A0A7C8JMZ9_ORBOL|nr:hypothetical protein TWF706_003892 [Orbilia oligospora]KAF3102730.1 hypothetical protein TWF102_004396 [Orbilia oligospora]KAF3110417.1 hypothetical protein TWF103_004692 [Orbilia oligospora]KAF3136313.1 hypothetical protein TWF594_007949 [Orbilia oligospora]